MSDHSQDFFRYSWANSGLPMSDDQLLFAAMYSI